MIIPLPEVIDRITILNLKIENGGSVFIKELEEYKKALKEFESKGIKIKQEWLDSLYEINKYQWSLESSLKKLRGGKSNLEKIGKIYIELQLSNKSRVAVKNKISVETGSGFKDIKVN